MTTVLTFCLYELALNPDMQKEARRAVQEAYRKYDGQFTYEMLTDINQLMEGKIFILTKKEHRLSWNFRF